VVIFALLLDLLFAHILFGPSHLTWDLKSHEEDHCINFKIPKEQWIYKYTNESISICTKEVGGLAEGCAISNGKTCTIILPEIYK